MHLFNFIALCEANWCRIVLSIRTRCTNKHDNNNNSQLSDTFTRSTLMLTVGVDQQREVACGPQAAARRVQAYWSYPYSWSTLKTTFRVDQHARLRSIAASISSTCRLLLLLLLLLLLFIYFAPNSAISNYRTWQSFSANNRNKRKDVVSRTTRCIVHSNVKIS